MIIPVAFCASDKYLDLVLTAIWSILLKKGEEDEYHFIIVHLGISPSREIEFRNSLERWPSAKIEFFDASDIVQNIIGNVAAKETWLSLLLPDIFRKYKKILSLDADIIVQRDISELYKEDVSNVLLAAALDPDFIGQYHGRNYSYLSYYRDKLHLKNPYRYVQGGIYLLNLEGLRRKFAPGFLFKTAALNHFRFDDQDVINLFCDSEIKILDMRWNVLYDSLWYRRRYIIGLAPKSIQSIYEQARTDPWIIHYAGGIRPWQDIRVDYSSEFWTVAKQTPRYNSIKSVLMSQPSYYRENSLIRRLLRIVRFGWRKTMQSVYSVFNNKARR